MMNILKEMWYKWRASACLARVDYYGQKRIELKELQLALKKRADEHSEKVREIRRLSKQKS